MAKMSVMHSLAICLQALVSASVFFVWVVRYDNIMAEFKQFGYPDWLRDLVGILKITCSILLLIGISRKEFAVTGAIGIAVLMIAAFVTHIRVKNPIHKMMPSVSLMICSIVIALLNNTMLAES